MTSRAARAHFRSRFLSGPLVERIERSRDVLGALEVALSGVLREPYVQSVQRHLCSA